MSQLTWIKHPNSGAGPKYVYDLRLGSQLIATVIGPYDRHNRYTDGPGRYAAIRYDTSGPNPTFDTLEEAKAWCLGTWRLEK